MVCLSFILSPSIIFLQIYNFIHETEFRTYNNLGDLMDKIKIGIPRALPYYYYGNLWRYYFEELGFEVVMSPITNKDMVDIGTKIANDEMCLSLKIYLGHMKYLESKCDYILVPRIDNYGTYEQTCTNFLSLYDLVQNYIETPLLTYQINWTHFQYEEKGLVDIAVFLGKGKEQAKLAYYHSLKKVEAEKRIKKKHEEKKLESSKMKLLMVSHPYNYEDPFIGGMIQKILCNLNVDIIDATVFTSIQGKEESKQILPDLYWKWSRELTGAILMLKEKIDGILFLSSFPCGPDSLVNELLMRKIELPHLNLIIDDLNGSAGMETRLESFVDIIEQKRYKAR